MTQDRLAKFVFSAIVVALTAYWLWFIFTHADKIFQKLTARLSASPAVNPLSSRGALLENLLGTAIASIQHSRAVTSLGSSVRPGARA
jgi:hypothetical protein